MTNDEQTPIDREMQTLLRQRNELADRVKDLEEELKLAKHDRLMFKMEVVKQDSELEQLKKQLAAMQG